MPVLVPVTTAISILGLLWVRSLGAAFQQAAGRKARRGRPYPEARAALGARRRRGSAVARRPAGHGPRTVLREAVGRLATDGGARGSRGGGSGPAPPHPAPPHQPSTGSCRTDRPSRARAA